MNQEQWNDYCNWYYYNYYNYPYNSNNNSYYEYNNNNTYIPPHKRNKKEKIKLENFSDLIKFTNNINKYYVKNIDIYTLIKMKGPLNKLNKMIGLENVKEQIFYQLLFFLQRLDNENNDMLHTIIEGEPGLGKTELAKILGDIYCSLKNFNKFYSVKRSDLIGGYLGQTAIKTQKKLEECKNGVIFIDEAYSLGNDNNGDSYSKEALDTINSYLSENKRDIICIIAGYKDELKKCFFNQNKGLERRFPWKYTIEKYNEEELFKIFKYIVENNGWKIDNSIDKSFFKTNYDKFKNNGGDCEILFHKSKLIYSKNYVNNKKRKYKLLNIEDLNNSIDIFDTKSKDKDNYNYMYS